MPKIHNPYNNEVVGEYEYTHWNQLECDLEILSQSYKKSKLTKHERASVLRKLSFLLLENKRSLAELITNEMGKTISDSLVEIDRTSNTALACADYLLTMSEEVLDSDSYPPLRDRMGIVKRFPIGVVLAITPFNFPLNLSMHKIAPAFAMGNSILFKPGPQNYFSGKRLVELAHQAGIPKDLLIFCCPDIPQMKKLTSSSQIQCISFTGGTATADTITKSAGRKKLLFELGGNDPLIVMDDGDLDQASTTTINMRFGTAGQRCTAAKRIFVHSKVYERFKTLLVAKADKLVVGNPLDEKTFVGPVVNTSAADVVEKRIQNAVSNGAKCLLGNKREGNIIYPTILENISKSEELICDETFGPVVPLIKFNDIDEVIETVNSSRFGLQSGVFTNKMDIVKRLFNELEVGALAVNDGPGFRAEHFPFGGVKDSGLGREGVKYTMEELSELKTLIL